MDRRVDGQGHPISTVISVEPSATGQSPSSLSVSDPAGNQFSAIANAGAALSRSSANIRALLVNGGSATILTADAHPRGVSALPGWRPNDSGTVTFSDQAGHAVVVAIVNGAGGG